MDGHSIACVQSMGMLALTMDGILRASVAALNSIHGELASRACRHALETDSTLLYYSTSQDSTLSQEVESSSRVLLG